MVIPPAPDRCFGLQRGNDAAEVHWFQGVVQFQLFSDRGPQVNIEADVFITLLKFKRNKRRIGGDYQFLSAA